MTKLNLTKEQEYIIDLVGNQRKNVVVNAVAGSGKTTTMLELANQHQDLKILIITYNRGLMDASNLRKQKMGLTNVDIYTYHSYASLLNQKTISNDSLFIDFLNQEEDLSYRMKAYDIICIDEMQDCNQTYFRFIKYLDKINPNQTYNMLVVGDELQEINTYVNADSRYLTNINDLFTGKEFVNASLSQTFRCSNNITQFVNNILLGRKYVTTTNDDKDKVTYFFSTNNSDIYTNYSQLFYVVIDLIKNKGYKPDDIFVLVPATKSLKKSNNSPIKKEFLNNLTYAGINLNIIWKEDVHVSTKDLQKNKLTVMTYNASKGLENKVIIMTNFDNGYFYYYNSDYKDLNICPNLLYVGATRAIDKLIIIGGKNSKEFDEYGKLSSFPAFIHNNLSNNIKYNNYLEFKNGMYKDYFISNFLNVELNKPTYHREFINKKEIKKDVIDFVKHIDSSFSYKFNQLLKKISTKKSYLDDEKYKVKSYIKNEEKDIYENVSDINGLYFPMELVQTKLKHIYDVLYKQNESLFEEKDKVFKLGEFSTADKLKLLLYVDGYNTELIYRMNQINRFDWLDGIEKQGINDIFLKRLENIFNINNFKKDNFILEQNITFATDNGRQYQEIAQKILDKICKKYPNVDNNMKLKITLNGKLDFITISDDDTQEFYEVKVVNELNDDHYLQVITYMWLINTYLEINDITKQDETSNWLKQPFVFKELKEYHLFNISNNEHIIIENNKEIIEEIIVDLFYINLFNSEKTSNDNFIKNNLNINQTLKKSSNFFDFDFDFDDIDIDF